MEPTEIQSVVDDISKSFNYRKKVANAPGKFWFEHYSPWQSMYALLAIHRNERVIHHATGGKRLLDLGCGFGDMQYLMRDKYEELYGLDPSIDMVEQARSNLAAHGLGDRTFVDRGLAESLGFEDGFFDTVLMLDVYEHIRPETRRIALGEVRRVLKPGGQLLLATPSRRMLKFWNGFDNVMQFVPKLLKRERIRLWSLESQTFTEVFCTRRELVDDIHRSEFKLASCERVGFYPAAENPGFLSPWLRRTRRVRLLHSAGRRVFRGVAACRLLNQKLLVNCTVR